MLVNPDHVRLFVSKGASLDDALRFAGFMADEKASKGEDDPEPKLREPHRSCYLSHAIWATMVNGRAMTNAQIRKIVGGTQNLINTTLCNGNGKYWRRISDGCYRV